VSAVLVFTSLVTGVVLVLVISDRIAARRERNRHVYVSKRCLRVFDPDPERSTW
jgi:hypothetical protein